MDGKGNDVAVGAAISVGCVVAVDGITDADGFGVAVTVEQLTNQTMAGIAMIQYRLAIFLQSPANVVLERRVHYCGSVWPSPAVV